MNEINEQWQEKKDFLKYMSLAVQILESPLTDDSLDQVVQSLKRFKFIQEILKIAQLSEVKELIKYAVIMKVQAGEIFRDHQDEIDCLYLIAFGQFWMLQPQHNQSTIEKLTPLIQLNSKPSWWYLVQQNRLREQINELLYQLINRQGRIATVDTSDTLVIRNSIVRPYNRRKVGSQKGEVFGKTIFNDEEITPQRSKIQYNPGDIICSKLQGDSRLTPLLFIKVNGVIIKIPQNGIQLLISKVLSRLKIQQLEGLTDFYLFQNFRRNSLEQQMNEMMVIECSRGYTLFRQNEKVTSFYILKEGEIEVNNLSNQIKLIYERDVKQKQQLMKTQQPISLLSENQMIGEEDFLMKNPHRSYSAVVRLHLNRIYSFFQIKSCSHLLFQD